jgi:hypothetical protein
VLFLNYNNFFFQLIPQKKTLFYNPPPPPPPSSFSWLPSNPVRPHPTQRTHRASLSRLASSVRRTPIRAIARRGLQPGASDKTHIEYTQGPHELPRAFF